MLHSLLIKIAAVFTALATLLSGPTLGNYNPTGGTTYRLQSSVGTSDTSIALSSFKEPVSNISYTMSYLNSDIEYATIEPQSSHSEFISFSGITQNTDGTALLTGVIRGLARTPGTGGCVASSTLAQSHSGQSILILSNPPCQLAEYLPLRTVATSTAATVVSSTTPWHYDMNPSFALLGSTTLVSLGYVDAAVVAGCANANTTTRGCVELATQTEAASSTVLGGTGAIVAYGNGMATDTPNSATRASRILMSDMAGFLKQAWLDLTAPFSVSGLWTFTGATSTVMTGATSTDSATLATRGIGTSTPMNIGGGLVVAKNGYFAGGLGVGVATTSPNNLVVSGIASTTKLFVNSCNGCVSGGGASWEKVSASSGACGTGGGTTCSQAVSCSAGKVVIGGGGTVNSDPAGAYPNMSYPDTNASWTFATKNIAAGSGAYTITVYAICVNP